VQNVHTVLVSTLNFLLLSVREIYAVEAINNINLTVIKTNLFNLLTYLSLHFDQVPGRKNAKMKV
jgi:hypothetical protein